MSAYLLGRIAGMAFMVIFGLAVAYSLFKKK